MRNQLRSSTQVVEAVFMQVSVTSAQIQPGLQDKPLVLRVTFSDGGEVSLYSTYHSSLDASERLAGLLRLLPDTAHAISIAEAERNHAIEARNNAFRRVREIESRLKHLLSGGRLFGKALVVADSARGGYWLQDPVKRDSGFGFYFSSLTELWSTFPDLRPVSWENGDLIVESWGYQSAQSIAHG